MSLDDEEKRRPPLRLKVLNDAQRQLWKELSATPQQFTLYGGTALALRLGHRESVDFDFFTAEPFDPQHLKDQVPYLAGAEVTQRESDTLSVTLDRNGPVRMSFFKPKALKVLGDPYEVRRPRLKLASLIDLAATKLNALTNRAEAKDYLDIHALLTKARIPLLEQLIAISFVFDERNFNPMVVLKALSYFGEPELQTLPDRVKRDLAQAVAAVDLNQYETRRRQFTGDPTLWKRYS